MAITGVGTGIEDVDVDGMGTTGTGIDDVKTIGDEIAIFDKSGSGTLKFVDNDVEEADETILDVGTGSGDEIEDGTIDGTVLETEADCC